jgi:GNAT superfamily N-acetyltransferase
MPHEFMLVQKDEFLEWLEEEPVVIQYLLDGYAAVISDIRTNICTDPRALANDHIVNSDFSICPRFIMGFQPLRAKKQFILSCLYVFPKFRRLGYATKLFGFAKKVVQSGGYIHVAVEKEKLSYLHAD